MIKDITEKNNNVTLGAKEVEVLRENFPACFHADGSFDIERFKEYLKDKINVTDEGYALMKNITACPRTRTAKTYISAVTI